MRDDYQENLSNISNKNSFVIKWPEAFIVVYQKNYFFLVLCKKSMQTSSLINPLSAVDRTNLHLRLIRQDLTWISISFALQAIKNPYAHPTLLCYV